MRQVALWMLTLLVSATLCGNTQEVSSSDVRRVMHELFAYHVESKELTPELYKRTIKICIEQFDPHKVYLLNEEAETYLSLSQAQAKQGVEAYYKDDFSAFDTLFALFAAAQSRHAALRNTQSFTHLSTVQSLSQGYTTSENALAARIHQYYLLRMHREASKVTTSSHNVQRLFTYVVHQQTAHEEVFTQKYVVILKAMTKSLDAHSGYYSPTEALKIRARLRKQSAGTGITFRDTYQGVFVTKIHPTSPAARDGGIQVGDQLIAVNGTPTDQQSFQTLMDSARGEVGSSVRFAFQRGTDRYTKTLTRENIVVEDARVKVHTVPHADGVIAVVTVPAFYDSGDGVNVTDDFKAAIREASLAGPLKGVVIDMRDNAGGFLSQAVKFSSLFIAKGIVVVSRYSDGEVRYSRNIDGRHVYDGPLVLLTSKASASCTEIVAQALQDYGVALVVGDRRTYGKGSMQYQTITDQYAKAYYKVTVGRYYTASGRSTQLDGVIADIHVPTKYAPYNVGEKYLQYPIPPDHLTGTQIETLSAMHSGSFKKAPRSAIPYLQPRETIWRQMKNTLAKNSAERLKRNKNYQNYLKKIYRQTSSPHDATHTFGANDLQVEEAVHIVQDMNALQQSITVQD